MAAIYIVRRRTKAGEPRFLVRYQEGRADPQVHLGSFRTMREAQERRRWAALEVAAGRPPSIGALREALRPAPRVRLGEAVDDWLATRVDVAPTTLSAYRARANTVLDYFGDRAAESITTRMVQEWVRSSAAAPWTIRGLVSVLRQVLAHAGVETDPCDERRLHYPRLGEVMKTLPTRAQLAEMYANLDGRDARVVGAMEHLGLRINEAVGMVHAQVDYPRGRVLVGSKSREAGRVRRRWVDYTAEWCAWSPPVDGAWSLYDKSGGTLRSHMAQACRVAGVRVVKPHDLRHLHASRLLHYAWLSPAQIAERLGHASPKTTLATYTHLVPPD